MPNLIRLSTSKVTSYSVLASEHAAFLQREIDEKAAKKKNTDDASDSDDSDPPFGRTVAKKAPTNKSKKVMDALFQVKWWRIVLGKFALPSLMTSL